MDGTFRLNNYLVILAILILYDLLHLQWLFQEHVVHVIVKLLSPPVPPNYTGPSHLIDHMSMLSAILFGASTIDTVHVLSLHGMVSELIPCCIYGTALKFLLRNI